MRTKAPLLLLLGLAFVLPIAGFIVAAEITGGGRPARPQGPCDVYAAGGSPCVAAHSSVRALYAAYNGPLYQVMRQSDGKTLDIGVVQPSASPVADAGGYADAAAQDTFCANTYCWITTLYDQSGNGNNLVQAPRGGFSGPAMGGFNNLPVADWAPVLIGGHPAYGVFIAPGMGLRWNNAKGTAVDDQAEGQYWVVNGHHYNGNCCFDYGNAETDSRDDGPGTMETTYYGNSSSWYHGPPPGPWVMTDQEDNLVGCVNSTPNNKLCTDLPSLTSSFVTGIAKGEPHHWTSMAGDSQNGNLKTMWDGRRVSEKYDPMRKQGAILLGNGGDNSNGAQGTFYEGAMTAAGTFPSDALDQKVQANIVAAHYSKPPLTVATALAIAAPPGLQTFSPGSSRDTALSFTNSTDAPVSDVKLSLTVPAGWTSVLSGSSGDTMTFRDPIPPSATVSATFKVTSGPAAFNGDLIGNVSWGTNGEAHSLRAVEKVRNVGSIKINEISPTFIELLNLGATDVDLSNWSLIEHPTQQPIFSAVKLPAGTRLAAGSVFLLALSDSGLAVPAHKGDTALLVRNIEGMKVDDSIDIDTGFGMETRKIATIGTAATNATMVWQPLPDGPVITIPAGSSSVPVTSVSGFAVGQKMAIGYGTNGPSVAKDLEQYEVVTITRIGKPGTQTLMLAAAPVGATSISVKNAVNISPGEQINLDIDSVGHGRETVTVKEVRMATPVAGKATNAGTLELAEPLKFHHSANTPFSTKGTGISFESATAFAHSSNEPVLQLGTGITLDKPLDNDHAIHSVVSDASVTTAGYAGPAKPNQWFGGPAIAANAGAVILRDAGGLVVDSVNYGGLVDPWASAGYQGKSPGNGCSAPTLAPSRKRGTTAPVTPPPPASIARISDTDSNCSDFRVQTPTPGAPNKEPQQ